MAADPNEAAQIFQTAISKLKQTVSPTDALAFETMHSEDVWKAAENIQSIHREKKALRNMRRIEPFLEALGKYSTAVDILCNGTPYLPWIWVSILQIKYNISKKVLTHAQAPIKLMLQV
jgi:hypothetical protein